MDFCPPRVRYIYISHFRITRECICINARTTHNRKQIYDDKNCLPLRLLALVRCAVPRDNTGTCPIHRIYGKNTNIIKDAFAICFPIRNHSHIQIKRRQRSEPECNACRVCAFACEHTTDVLTASTLTKRNNSNSLFFD